MTIHQAIAHNLEATMQPMTRLEYNQFRGWTLPDGEDPGDPGYLMNFGFHTAWWPADVVDKAFVALPQPHPISSACMVNTGNYSTAKRSWVSSSRPTSSAPWFLRSRFA